MMTFEKSLVLVAVGSALGGVLRFWLSHFLYYSLGKNFPWGTLVVNLVGCFLIGIIFTLLIERFHANFSVLHDFFVVGFLGGLTTFSAFSFEAFNLIENFLFGRAIAYISISIGGCLLLTGLGIFIGKRL